MQLSEKRDAHYYERISRSLHGLSLLKALCPIPPSNYNCEHMYRLLSMLFAWLEAVSFKASIHVHIVEIVDRYQSQAIHWITKVQNDDFYLYCDCLLPMPPVQARIGLGWGSLMSETRQLLEGLQRISSLVRLGLLPETVSGVNFDSIRLDVSSCLTFFRMVSFVSELNFIMIYLTYLFCLLYPLLSAVSSNSFGASYMGPILSYLFSPEHL